MKKYMYKIGLVIAMACIATSCDLEDIDNPNGPSIGSVENGATLADLRLVAIGLESVIRVDMEFYYETVAILAREYYDLNNVDPRYTGELLGAGGGILDNNGFLTTRSFAARYRAVRNAELLLTALANSNAGLSAEQENGFSGFAKTIKAYQLLLVANRQFSNGIKVNSDDDTFTGSYDASLSAIQTLLQEASSELTGAGDEFAWPISSGFTGFDTPATFNQFNRALAARISIYQNDRGGALTALNASFLDLAGDLGTGPAHVFSAAGNDILNPLFYVPDQDLYVVHPTWLTDAEAGDTRVAAKTTPFSGGTVTADDLSGDTQVTLYDANNSPVPIMRNEELVLLYAEANIGSDNAEAVTAINIIRAAAGLTDYAGATDDDSLIDEILNQRRYALFGEGHRWIDLRRFGRLGEVPLDRSGDQVFEEFPRPITEG